MRKAIEKIFEARKAPLIFLLGIYIVGITTGSLAEALKAVAKPWLLSLAGTIVLLLLVILIDPEHSFLRWIRRNIRATPESEPEQKPARYPGLIVCASVGMGISSAETAIRYHWKGVNNEFSEPLLKYCWIITGGEDSKKEAQNLMSKLISDDFPSYIFRPMIELSAEDADNPEAVYNAINKIYDEILDIDLSESDIIADYTGGTKSMTSGMILACALPGRKLQFMKPKEYDSDGRANRSAGSVPVLVDINFKLKPLKR